MQSFLFTIGVGVSDRPERWHGICEIYAQVAEGLTQLGHRCRFIVNPSALDAKALAAFEASVGDHREVQRALAEQSWDRAFIWGGRIKPDIETAALLSRAEVPVIYSELGWFPQRGTIYFDHRGTNSEMSYEEPPALNALGKLRFAKARARACRKIYDQRFLLQPYQRATFPRSVFVPLQDETDTNITIDSPFKTMDEMLRFLSVTYPDHHFTARMHPKAAAPKINNYPNVVIQDPSCDPYKHLRYFGAIAGINSTMITEAAFLGCDTFCFGRGIAHTYGLARFIDPSDPPPNLIKSGHTRRAQRDASLAYLYLNKQLQQSCLSSPTYLKGSYLGEILGL